MLSLQDGEMARGFEKHTVVRELTRTAYHDRARGPDAVLIPRYGRKIVTQNEEPANRWEDQLKEDPDTSGNHGFPVGRFVPVIALMMILMYQYYIQEARCTPRSDAAPL